jgi:DNA-binding HxlR family transcriptional regulator
MQRKSFSEMACPIARSLDRVGEWWSMLILRDAFAGLSRFDDFQQSLGIAPAMLTRRLNALVDHGLLERRRYSERPPRDEYVLTQRGRDFRPVLQAFMAWGNRHFTPEGISVQPVDAATGVPAEPVLVDAATGRRLNPARDVVIGDRVWVGYRAFVGKGSEIGSGSVVGAQSVVTGKVAPQTLVAGQPARLLREGIEWSAALL